MIKVDDLTNELSKYEIPNEDQIISWFINGDRNATLENWRFYQRCILGMLHLDEHLGAICETKKEFDNLEKMLRIKTSQTDDLNEIRNLIDAFLSCDNLSKSHLVDNNELMNYVKLYAGTSKPVLYKDVEINERKVREIKNNIEQDNKIIEILSSAREDIKQGREVSTNFLKNQKEVKFNIFMSKNKKIALIDEKIKELKDKISHLNKQLALEELSVKKNYINGVIEFLNSEYVGKNNLLFERLKNDLTNLSEEQLIDIPIDYLKKFKTSLSYFSNNLIKGSYIKNMENDIIACAHIFKYFWNDKWSKDKSFMELCVIIRSAMAKAKATSEFKISDQLRENELASDNDGFIKGAMLNKEQIASGMKILSHKYDDILKISDTKEYVSECAKLLHDFIMLHPFTDGNGRTSRLIFQKMLASRNIFIPSLFDSYYHRIQYGYEKNAIKSGHIFEYLNNFSTAENLTAYNNDYTYIVNYIINRVHLFYPDLIPIITEESVKKITDQVDNANENDRIGNVIAELENYKGNEVSLDESKNQKCFH